MLLQRKLELVGQFAVLCQDDVLLCVFTLHIAYLYGLEVLRLSMPVRVYSFACPLMAQKNFYLYRASASLARNFLVARNSVFLAVSSVVESISPIVLNFKP